MYFEHPQIYLSLKMLNIHFDTQCNVFMLKLL